MLLPYRNPLFWGKITSSHCFDFINRNSKRPMEQKTSSRAQRWKQILAIAWPLIVANWNLQLTIDRIYLGAWSTEALERRWP